MILDPASYLPKTERMGAEIRLPGWDLLPTEEYCELEAAQATMREILQFAGISEDRLAGLVESNGPTWFQCGEEMTLPWTNKDVNNL